MHGASVQSIREYYKKAALTDGGMEYDNEKTFDTYDT